MNKDNYFSGDFEYSNGQSRPITNRFDADLFDEEKNVIQSTIRIKRVASSKKENWKVFKNNEMIYLIEGNKLGKKEKEFLRTLDGINFLISQFKYSVPSFSSIKRSIGQKIKSNAALTKKRK